MKLYGARVEFKSGGVSTYVVRNGRVLYFRRVLLSNFRWHPIRFLKQIRENARYARNMNNLDIQMAHVVGDTWRGHVNTPEDAMRFRDIAVRGGGNPRDPTLNEIWDRSDSRRGRNFAMFEVDKDGNPVVTKEAARNG